MFARFLSTLTLMLMVGCSTLTPSSAITPDPHWTSVTLGNGFQYHLYPIEGRDVEIRLVVNVGSLNEQEEERGYAHFIEHMAFNGTKRFPHNSVFDAFAAVGVEFGPDINAVTDYGRTVYQLSLPDMDSAEQALAWFRDIGDGLLLDKEEVDSEIGVIFGEWRQDNRSEASWQLKLYNTLLKGSPYIQRDPIGTEKALTNAISENLQAFYTQWYQANRMQLVIVGGIEVETLSAQINKEFASLRTSHHVPEQHVLPDINSAIQYPLTLYAPQGESPAVVLSFPNGRQEVPTTLREQRDTWLSWMVIDAIQLRLEEQFDRMGISHNGIYNSSPFTPGFNVHELVVAFNNVDRNDVLEALAKNVASLRDQGVSSSEFHALVEQYRSSVNLFDEATPIEVAETAVQELYTNRLPQDERELNANFEDFLDTLSFDVFNASLNELLISPNQGLTLVYASGEPLSDAEALKQSYFSALKQRGEEIDVAYLDIQIPQPNKFYEGEITVDKQDDNLFEWQLPNGIPVIFYQVDRPTYESYVLLQAKGGLSVLSRKERAALELLFETYRTGKVGDIEAFDFSHYLEVRGISIEPQVLSKSHNLTLVSPNGYLPESMNALRYLVEQIKPNSETFMREKARIMHRVQSAKQSPYDVFGRASLDALYPLTSYESPLSVEDYEAVTLDDVEYVYNKLFSDLGHFRIYVVSDESLSTIENLVTGYLGGIATERRETPPVANQYNRKGDRTVKHTSPEYRTYVERVYVSDAAPRTLRLIFAEDMLNRVLQSRYNDLVREKYALSYDPYFSSWTWDGEAVSVTSLTALISPEREKQLTSLWPDIQRVLSAPVTKRERDNAARQLSRDMYDIGNDGLYMVGALARYDLWGYGVEGVLYPDEVISHIDEHVLTRLASQLFEGSALFESILRPNSQQ
ncbi:M16 family metallopeptidase [Enterovibrio sp. 27052020O]|uniref:M16 family metallopeptidase n=1 Tax=Enterovibrio sp. 27052020O TaxID=3241166 RepID=UPI00388F7795